MDSSKRALRQKGTTSISKQRLVSACFFFFFNFNLALSSRLLFGSVIYSTGSKATKKFISHHVVFLSWYRIKMERLFALIDHASIWNGGHIRSRISARSTVKISMGNIDILHKGSRHTGIKNEIVLWTLLMLANIPRLIFPSCFCFYHICT